MDNQKVWLLYGTGLEKADLAEQVEGGHSPPEPALFGIYSDLDALLADNPGVFDSSAMSEGFLISGNDHAIDLDEAWIFTLSAFQTTLNKELVVPEHWSATVFIATTYYMVDAYKASAAQNEPR